MSASPVPRPVIRCSKCGLNQFDRVTCRKCGQHLHVKPTPLALEMARKLSPLSLDTIGYRVHQYRLNAKLSQKQLAARLKLKSRTYVSRIENGHCVPLSDQIIRIADALRINPAHLIPPQGLSVEEVLWQVGELAPLLTEENKWQLVAYAAELSANGHKEVNAQREIMGHD